METPFFPKTGFLNDFSSLIPMKLHSLKIDNFRAIDHLELDFTDSLSRPRPVTLIVGPNGSGKTSILDAVQVVISTLENPYQPRLREGLEWSAAQLVRGRGTQTQIEFEYSIEEEEAKAINDTYQKLGYTIPFKLSQDELIPLPPFKSSATVTWQYPNLQKNGKKPYNISTSPKDSACVLGARGKVSQAVKKNQVQQDQFERVGGICYLDQRRSLRLAKNFSKAKEEGDVLSWLDDFYRKHSYWRPEKYGESYWGKIQRLFNQICHPAQLIGLESGPDIDTLILKRNGIEYDLLQMSSGEHQILKVLVALASETAVNSIVLVDEVELHDSNNQYIFTTHSPYVIESFFTDEIIELGDLT
jgi:energy-coupling factor transporter ATP-binding protein EcfA2